ncbi:MAG: glycosyl hydrolase family 3, partial [Cyclobacteriaceae bacterium]
MNTEIKTDVAIDHKVESLLAQMTLDEKIGQMTQVRHFDDITIDEIKTKFIGSIIHTQGPTP